jgi:hypothetical protein
LVLSGNVLYGTAAAGSYGGGTIFAINTDGTGFTNLYSFTPSSNRTNSDGVGPTELILSGNTFSPAPVIVNGQNTVTNPISGTQMFFRLSQ